MISLAKAQRRKVSRWVRQPTALPFIKLPWNEVIELPPKDRDSIAPDDLGNCLSKDGLQIDGLIRAGAQRLLARSANMRGLEAGVLVPRLRASVDKYVLKDEPEPDPARIEKFLDGLHADDLCLVIACERGDQIAWSDLFEGYGATVRSAARSASSNEAMADDVAQSIWADLHGLKMREDGQPAGKLAYYSGAGSLGGWLRAVVGQLAIDQHRRQSRLVQTEEDTDLERLAHDASGESDGPTFHSAQGPEELLAREMASADVEKALGRSLGELDDEDRLLMKLYYFDGLRLREAGAVLGVHEATASRRLTRIHGQVRERVESILMKEHGWTKTEATRSLAEVAAHLQTEVEPMLAGKGGQTLQGSPAPGG
jgi:RNA polymerase sigma-70 factor (ECF subfamily)